MSWIHCSTGFTFTTDRVSTCSRATSSRQVGVLSISTAFQIVADGNRLKNNRAQGNRTGIHVTSHGNTLTGNAGSGNNVDASDDDPNCDDNVWKNNQFGLTQPCVR